MIVPVIRSERLYHDRSGYQNGRRGNVNSGEAGRESPLGGAPTYQFSNGKGFMRTGVTRLPYNVHLTTWRPTMQNYPQPSRHNNGMLSK